MSDILNQINKEKDEFKNDLIIIVDKFEFNQKETIEQIYRYYHSRYKSGPIDNQGDKKYFFNIVRTPCNVATKAVDFDTKDIRVQTASGGEPLQTWYFKRDLEFWMKDKGFGKVLNRLFHELPIYGSVVLKVIKGIPHFVDLRNFIVEQNADTLADANYIIEEHNYTPVEFRRVAKEKGWKNREEVLESYREHQGNSQGDPNERNRFKDTGKFIKVYERYGEVEEDGAISYKRIIATEIEVDDEDEENEKYILDEMEVDELPYKEFHWEKIPGRWLGVGRVEILFDAQIRVNELSNQRVKSSYYSTLRLWQTRDETVNRNLMTDTENGDVLPVESEITQVDMGDRNLAHYNQELSQWLAHRDAVTFSSDVMQGQRPPAGTPLGSTRLATGLAGSYFDQIQENIAEDIKTMLYEDIIPQFEKENEGKHVLRIAGEDLEKLNDMVINQKAKNSLFSYMADNGGELPSKRFFETKRTVLSEMVKQGKEKLVKIPRKFYKDLKYKIDIVITGESIDSRTKAAALFAGLQAVSSDPTLLSDPTKKRFFTRWLEQNGISPPDVEPETGGKEGLQQLLQQRGGGGVSRPAIPNVPTEGQNERRI